MDIERENESLIEHIKSIGYLKSKALENALREVPRHLFVPNNMKELAYRDTPLSIGHDQTISQPSTVVIMTEALDVKAGQKILEIGTGSGWQAAILAKLAGKNGFVYTVEIVSELIDFAKDNLKKVGLKNVKVIKGDGSLGLKEYAPYDRIIVTAACPDIPKSLLNQLRAKGILIIPVGNLYLQEMYIIKKLKGKIEKKSMGSFMFVPLTGRYGFK